MRWIVLAFLCLAAIASAKFVKENKNRLGRMLKTFADDHLIDDFDNDSQDNWSDEDWDSSEEDEPWLERRHIDQRRHQQQKQQKRHPTHCTNCQKQKKWTEEDDEDFENEDQQEQRRRTPEKHRKQQHREDDFDQPQEPCQPNYDLLRNLDQINTQLAAKLHMQARQMNDDRNTVVSPVGVQLALAAVNQGARGNTKRQINQLLDYGMPKNQNQNAYSALARVLKGQNSPDASSGKNVQIKTTTGVILGRETAQEKFLNAIKKCFDGEVKRCDFRNQPQQCRQQINDWISSKTGQKSHPILSEQVMAKITRMIAVSTMQVKTNWGKQFRKSLKTTQGQFFALGDQQPTTVKMLQAEGEFNYFEDSDLKMLGVQTQEKQLTTYIVLPKRRHGLNQVEKQRLQYGKQLQQLMEECDSSKQSLKVHLPYFQVAHQMDVKDTLRKMGIEDAFEGDQADFTGIQEEHHDEQLLKYGKRQTGGLEDIDVERAARQHKQQQDHLHLNKILQQASIQIGEQGIDAASDHTQHSGKQKQTGRDEDEPREQHEFVADHAFVFMVKHNPSNQVLLIGRVVDAMQEAGQQLE